MMKNTLKNFGRAIVIAVAGLHSVVASAGLFDDEEARKAILDLRQRVETTRLGVESVRSESVQGFARANEDSTLFRRSLLDLQNQIETLRTELAKFRGLNEQLTRDVSDLQRRQKDILQGVDERIRQFEPIKVAVDGTEFSAEPAEKKEYEAAFGIFKKGDFANAQTALVDFLKRYPQSGYGSAALFWLGNAQYATRDYKEAMINFRSLVGRDPQSLRAPEAALSIANCQIELKDARGARKTLDDLIKTYPKSEAAVAAKERLLNIK